MVAKPLSKHLDGLQAIHLRHLPIQDHGKEVVSAFVRFPPRSLPLHPTVPSSRACQVQLKRGGAFAYNLVVIHDENGRPLSSSVSVTSSLTSSSWTATVNWSPSPSLRGYFNGAVHHAHDVLCYGPYPGRFLYFADSGILRA